MAAPRGTAISLPHMRLSACGSRNFRRKIALFLLDPLANCEAGHAGHRDRFTDLLGDRVNGGLHGAFAVDHEGLLEQDDVLVEFAETAFDHFGDNRLGLAGFPRLLRENRPDRKSTRLNSSHVKISYAVF